MAKVIIGVLRGSNYKGRIDSSDLAMAEDKLKGRWCICQNESGSDLAKIICLCEDKDCPSNEERPLGKLVRLIEDGDLAKIKEVKQFEAGADKECRELIEKHDLRMKLIRTILSFDERRLTFYFASEDRVDFRLLVKDLVGRFHKMIRLQQIGPRDHAKLLSGVGICGRELCCAKFLSSSAKITKDAAMRQGMESLSSDKISGACGKLMCCLRFELNDYEDKK